jgi:hypothetical protein
MHLKDIGETAAAVFLPWLFLSIIIGPRRAALALAVVCLPLALGLGFFQAAIHRETGPQAVMGETLHLTPFLTVYLAFAGVALVAGWALRKARGLRGDQSPFPVTRSS